ncbi:MAG: twin-arginine translocase subunit TatC [Spirochaetes bacterium]|nr:twin-arginine translocase subunit TatC [Spirochaetota bacterium]
MTPKKNIPKKAAGKIKPDNNNNTNIKNNKTRKHELAGYAISDTSAIERGDKPMTIVGHLNELRSRLIISLTSITLITFSGFLFFSDYLLYIVNKPYLKTGLKLNVFALSEGFIIRAKAALIGGIIVCLPIIVYEIWKYITPAISKKDRKFIGGSVIAAVVLLYSGMILTYFFLLPIAIKMLLSFTPETMNSIIGASKYLNFVFLFSFAMGLMCELPVLIMILTKLGIVSPRLLISKRKYAIVLIWIFAAILTPGPDILSQALVALPIMLLYEISIIISKIITKGKLKLYM